MNAEASCSWIVGARRESLVDCELWVTISGVARIPWCVGMPSTCCRSSQMISKASLKMGAPARVRFMAQRHLAGRPAYL